jgi:hypothetical protein
VTGRRRTGALDQPLVGRRERRRGPASPLPPLDEAATRVGDGPLQPLEPGDPGALLPALREQGPPRGDSSLLAGPVGQDVVRAQDREDDRPPLPKLEQRDRAIRDGHLIHAQTASQTWQVEARHVPRPMERPWPAEVTVLSADPLVGVVQQRSDPVDEAPALDREDREARRHRRDAGARQAAVSAGGEEAGQDGHSAKSDEDELGCAESEEQAAAVACAEQVRRGLVVRRHCWPPSGLGRAGPSASGPGGAGNGGSALSSVDR